MAASAVTATLAGTAVTVGPLDYSAMVVAAAPVAPPPTTLVGAVASVALAACSSDGVAPGELAAPPAT